MKTNDILVACLTALAFGTWPILAKYSGSSLAWTTVLIYLGGLTSVSLLAIKRLTTEPVCTLKAVLILGIASLINGLAVWFYANKSIDKEVNTSLFMVTTSLVGIVVTPLFNRVLNGEHLTNKQWIGITLSIVVIWLMKK